VIPIALLLDLGTLLLVAGIFLVLRNLLFASTEFIVHFWRRVFVTWAHKRLQQMGVIEEKPYRERNVLDTRRLAVILVIPILAIAVRDYLLSPIVVLVGLVVLLWMNFQKKQKESAQINEDAEIVALQIRSAMSLDRSILSALSKIELPEGSMKQALTQVVSRLRMHQRPDQAASTLKRLPGSVTARLAALIGFSASITDELQDNLLRTLEEEAHRQKLQRSKTHQTLSLVRGTIRLLQGAVAGAIVFVVLTPAWRTFFLQDIPHRVLLTALITSVTIASLYFEVEVYQMSVGEAF
jgi:hypothetical protein